MKKTNATHAAAAADEQLCYATKNGDENALDVLIGRYDVYAWRLCGGYRAAGMERDDLFQEAHIGLLKAVRSYDPSAQTPFFGFALLCMKRQLISAVRRQNAQKNLPLNQSLPFEEEVLAFNDWQIQGPENTVILQEEARQRRKQAIMLLSPLEKETLGLYLQSFTYKEMAKKLKCPEKKVDNTLQRIRRKLKTAQWGG